MKSIILLLVLLSAGMGQTTITNKDTTFSIFSASHRFIELGEPSYRFTLPKDSTKVCLDDTCFYTRENIYVAVFLFRYIQLWKEYKQECWNDSTATGGLASYVLYKTDSSQVSGGWKVKTTYAHRTSTFEGFMDWMENKSPR